MLKDIIIAILAGIVIVPPGDPERVTLVMGIAVMVFMVLLWIDDLWDKRQEITWRIQDIATAISKGAHSILRHAYSRIRWYRIRLRRWPVETAQRQRRRQMMQDYIHRLQSIQPQDKGRNPEESEI